MKTPLHWFCLALLLGTVQACGPGNDDDDTAGDDDTSVDLSLADSYLTTGVYDIEPSAAGQAFGLSACTLTIGATVEIAPDAQGCPDCEAIYLGPVTSQFTDCSGVEVDPDVTYGLARPAEDDLEIWSPGEAEWDLLGTATLLGGVFELVYDEEMGDETFSLGTMHSTLTFE
jgi:hypothetical protein